jgi:hypothetical protein
MSNNRPILIFGSGRSGTTWILDALAEANNLRTIFEPLNPIAVPTARPFANRYVRDDGYEPELRNLMDRVLTGSLRSLWANYRVLPDRLRPWSALAVFRRTKHNPYKMLLGQYMGLLSHYRRYKKTNADGIIIKFIRANLMIGWFARNYDAKIVLVVRHPASVISSRLRLMENSPGHEWGFEEILQRYRKDEHLREDYLYKYDHLLHRPLSLISGLTAIWCIENILPIIKAQKAGHCVVFYEDLIDSPKAHWKHVVQSLDLNAVLSREIYAKPSLQASIEMKNGVFDDTQLTKWTKYLSKKQLLEIDEILNIFHVTIYSAFNPLPLSRIQAHEHPQSDYMLVNQ